MLRALAWLYLILGGLGLAGGGLLLAGIAASPSPSAGGAFAFIAWLFLMLAVPVLLPAFLGGIGILLKQSWGRVFFAIASVLSLFAVPIGTVIGVLGLRALWSEAREANPSPDGALRFQPRSASGVTGILLAMAAVAAGFIVALQAGFSWHGQSAPLEISRVFPAAAAVIGVGAIWLLYMLFASAGDAAVRRRVRGKAQGEYQAFKDERAALIERLEADPDLILYADRIRAGESWNEAQIAYDRDRSATTTCEHLRDIEAAMRAADVPMKLRLPGVVHANCVVDEAALRARFPLDSPAWYGNLPHWDRSAEDPPAAAFKCDEHRATIFVVEASQARPGTRVFPGGA